MVLRQHGGDGIEFRRELKECKVVGLRVLYPEHVAGGFVDVRVFVSQGILFDRESREGKGFREVKLLLEVGIGRVAVVDCVTDVRVLRRERDVECVCGRAHGEHESSRADVPRDRARHRLFQLGDLSEAALARLLFELRHLGLVPGGPGE